MFTRRADANSFIGNARALLEDGLAGLIRVGQDRGIDVDHHLVALARGTGIEPVMERALREQGQGIGLLLGHRGRFRGNVPRACGRLYTLLSEVPGTVQGERFRDEEWFLVDSRANAQRWAHAAR